MPSFDRDRDAERDEPAEVEAEAEADAEQYAPCICRACGATFDAPYEPESYICDACLAAPPPRPRGVFEP